MFCSTGTSVEQFPRKNPYFIKNVGPKEIDPLFLHPMSDLISELGKKS